MHDHYWNFWIILRARFRVQDDVDQEEPIALAKHPVRKHPVRTQAYIWYVEESDDAVD